jgi:Calcineurin-like phosphoesterase
MVASADKIQQVIETMWMAAAHNERTGSRVGNVVELNAECGDDVLIAADLHGNRINFEKLLAIADLSKNERRHLIMQEVCHGGPTYPNGGCMSHLLLEDMASLKNEYPDRFHFILSNHELSELTDFAIMKSGRMLNLTFREGLQQLYGEQADCVRESYLEFLGSCPLAVRLESGVMISHSTPAHVDCDGYDIDVLMRPLGPRDFTPRGPIFRMVWGRDFREENAAAFAEMANASLLIHGHEPCAEGYQVPNSRQVILDSCSGVPCYVILPIYGETTQQDVVARITPIHPNRNVPDDG